MAKAQRPVVMDKLSSSEKNHKNSNSNMFLTLYVETTYLSFIATNPGDAKYYPFSRHVRFQVTFSFILEHPRPWSLLFYVTLRKTK